jgi:hypothetical protein
MTPTATKDPYEKACESAGMEEGRNTSPFLEFKKEVGGWVIGLLGEGLDVTYTPKKGKNKNKKQETVYFPFDCEKSGMKSAEEGKQYTISPTGLLLYQFTKGRPASVKLPARVAIKYLGRDDEDRHQTEVRWPKPD